MQQIGRLFLRYRVGRLEGVNAFKAGRKIFRHILENAGSAVKIIIIIYVIFILDFIISQIIMLISRCKNNNTYYRCFC